MFARNSRNVFSLLAINIIFIAFAIAARASAATFTVNQITDAGDMTCDAIDDANNLAGSDTIVSAAGVFRTAQIITLTGGELLIADSVNANVILY